MAVEIIPTGTALGAEVRGVDLSEPVGDDVKQTLVAAWYEHLVLLFRGQSLGDDALFDVAAIFGEIGDTPEGLLQVAPDAGRPAGMSEKISIVSNIVENGTPIGQLGAGEAEWHTDSSFVEVPVAASVLYGVEIPPAGGNTSFLNMYAALETLPPELRNRVEGRTANHCAVYKSSGERRPEFVAVTDVSKAPGARHPLIRSHPATGRKCLFLGRRLGSYIAGLSVPDSEALLDAVWAHATQRRFVWQHRWRVGDLLVWDNRCTMHHRDSFDPNARRRLHKVTTAGERPV